MPTSIINDQDLIKAIRLLSEDRPTKILKKGVDFGENIHIQWE